jgi:hypothetical protein
LYAAAFAFSSNMPLTTETAGIPNFSMVMQ